MFGLEAYLQGATLGLLLSVLLGPAFFALIQTSISKGFTSGAFLAMGIFLSDVFLVIICYFGLSNLLDKPSIKFAIGALGALFFLGYGLYLILNKKIKISTPEIRVREKGPSLMKGFLLNILNPTALIYWLGMVGLVSQIPDFKPRHVFYFFAGILTVVISTDLLKVYIAKVLQKYVTYFRILWLNRISGIVMMAFGAIVLIKMIRSEFW